MTRPLVAVDIDKFICLYINLGIVYLQNFQGIAIVSDCIYLEESVMIKNKRILVFAPHNDDEVLGVGGTMAILSRTNELFVCEITSSKVHEALQRIRREAKKAHDLLGVKEAFFLDLPVVGVKDVNQREVNKKFDDVVSHVKPHIVFLPHEGDIHTDHMATANAAMVALRPLPNPQLMAILSYETLSETEWNTPNPKNTFTPTVWFDIKAGIEIKKQAMMCYESQIRDYPHPRSIRAINALAEYRGSTIGVEYAECFMLLRGTVKMNNDIEG